MFDLGRLLITPAALQALTDAHVGAWSFLVRHITGDWGDLDPEDQMANNKALYDGLRVLSAYRIPNSDTRIWIITEADRSATTILLPEDY